METALKILITLDLCFFVAGIIMHAMDNQQYEIVTGLGILFLSFIIMPFFIFYRWRTRGRNTR